MLEAPAMPQGRKRSISISGTTPRRSCSICRRKVECGLLDLHLRCLAPAVVKPCSLHRTLAPHTCAADAEGARAQPRQEGARPLRGQDVPRGGQEGAILGVGLVVGEGLHHVGGRGRKKLVGSGRARGGGAGDGQQCAMMMQPSRSKTRRHNDGSLLPTCMRVLMVSAGCEDTVAIRPAMMPLSTYGPPGMSCAVRRGIINGKVG